MEDDYFNKMSDEVDMDMDMNEDDTFKNEDCSKFFTTIKVIIEFDLGFVIVILRLNFLNGQPEKRIFVVLDYERGDKYRQYKNET